ncbi:MAG: hypothetical protein FJX34_03285 [Alphaproteobacteria bacterium]|nr:hypothetical protein [Alphaproteobacteria bacterium]
MVNNPRPRRRKKFGLLLGIASSLLLIAFIAVAYFAILLSVKPRSIPFVTQKIELALQERFGVNNVSLDEASLSFTDYSKLRVSTSGLRIIHRKQVFLIPILHADFSLLSFLSPRLQIKKIKLVNPRIILSGEKNVAESQDDLKPVMTLLASIRSGENQIKNLEVENAKLLIFGREILLRKSKIHFLAHKILAETQLSFDEEKPHVDFKSDCQFASDGKVACDLLLQNVLPHSVADLSPNFAQLNQLNAQLDANISLTFADDGFNDVKFKIRTGSGDLNLPEFFEKKLDFKNLSLSGDYSFRDKTLNIFQLDADFVGALSSHLGMSLKVEQNQISGQKFTFAIKLKNIATDELEKFWPNSLNQNKVRSWVIGHISSGVIREASTDFSLTKSERKFHLNNISAKLGFTGLNLEYSKDFPSIKNISGNADFTRDTMKIMLVGGDVLQSKISEGLILIDDFDAPKVMLKISGKAAGHTASQLQQASNNDAVAKVVEKYLNGNSQSDFDIRLPLSDNITLKKSYIAINSAVSGLENEYLRGSLLIRTKKDFGSTNFVTNFDLTAAELRAKKLDLIKRSGVESGLNMIVALREPSEVRLSKILLWKKEGNKTEKFLGDVKFDTAPFLVKSANFQNVNFGKNSYSFSYTPKKISFRGAKINLAEFLSSEPGSGRVLSSFSISLAATRAELLHGKYLRNFTLSLTCVDGLCSSGISRAGYGKQKSLNLRIDKTADKNISLVSGRVSDIGYLAEGFGISNLVAGGDAKIKIQNYAIDKKPVLNGELTIDDEITIYESEIVKRFASDTLLSQIRDKIFSSDKMIFNSVKAEFNLQDGVLNLRSLIANNYKIGITAKGEIDLRKKNMHLKGMIIPGFLVNNLFGIGKIPLVGGVISGLLTGGEGGGVFGIRYEYDKNPGDKEGKFTTNKVAAFVPSTIQNLFE